MRIPLEAKVLTMQDDLHNISGRTQKEKLLAWNMFKKMRDINTFINGHKLNITTSGAWVIMLLFICKLLGIPIGLVWPAINAILKVIYTQVLLNLLHL